MQIGMPQANALKSIGYTDTVLFLTIGKPDIYQHKRLGKLATDFFIRVTKNSWNWLPTYLIFSAIVIRLTNRQLYIYRITNSQEEYVLYMYIPQILDAFASGIPICTGNR